MKRSQSCSVSTTPVDSSSIRCLAKPRDVSLAAMPPGDAGPMPRLAVGDATECRRSGDSHPVVRASRWLRIGERPLRMNRSSMSRQTCGQPADRFEGPSSPLVLSLMDTRPFVHCACACMQLARSTGQVPVNGIRKLLPWPLCPRRPALPIICRYFDTAIGPNPWSVC